MFGRGSKGGSNKRSEDVKKSAGKVLDTKKDTPTRAKHLRLFLDNSDLGDIVQFFDSYYSHIYFIVYDSFVNAEQSLRQKGAHKAQREELEGVLYLLEKVLIFLPEALSQRWQYHSIGRLMSKLLHPGNSWKLLKREAMRLFLLWYAALGEQAGDQVHAIFATLVPGFPSPYPNMGLTALAALTPEPGDGPVSAAPILPLIPPQSAERWKSPDTDLIRIFLDVLLELMVSQVILVEWRDDKNLKQKRAFNFLFEKFKTFYMPAIFPDFNWHMSLYKPSLELPEVRKFRPNFVDTGDGTKKMDPMLACRVVVIKWVAQFTHITRGGLTMDQDQGQHGNNNTLNLSQTGEGREATLGSLSHGEDFSRNSLEGQLVREVLYGTRHNVNFVHEVYRQSFLLSFSHSPAMKRVITVYKDWIQMNVQELPPFLLEPNFHGSSDDSYYQKGDDVDGPMGSGSRGGRADSYVNALHRDQMNVRAGLQNVLQLFVTNAANVFLLEVSPEYPILLEEQVEMCKRVLNIYRYMVMNVKMDGRTWEQLLFILLQITQLTLTETPPRRREDTLGGRLAQAIFQTLIVTWIKANLYVVVSCELWDQFLEVLSSLTLWEELIREWFKTMETLTRVLARQVYCLDLNDLPLDRLSEQKAKKKRGKTGVITPKISTSTMGQLEAAKEDTTSHPAYRGVQGSPYPRRRAESSSEEGGVRGRGSRRSTWSRPRPSRRAASEPVVMARWNHEQGVLEAAAWRMRQPRLSRSLGCLEELGRGEGSRSPSPAPSSSMESHSIKDSPVLLDHDTVSEGAYSEAGDVVLLSREAGASSRSVMSGGVVKGWLPDVAVVLWRRMLGSLGDVNTIADTVIHAQIYKYLIELHDIMVKIRANQGVSLDNLSTPAPPQYVPPFTIFAPWCFRALLLPDTYQRGRMYALRLLCLLTVRQQDTPLPRTHLVQFNKVLHTGLTSGDPDTLYNLVRFTGSRFFSLTLPGYSAFLFDYLAAANNIISSTELKGVPRTEAVSIAGSLLAYPSLLPSLSLLLPSPDQLTMVTSSELQDQVIGVLLKAGKKEPAGLARCIALSSLGIFVYRELVHETYHPKLKEAITVLLAALKFNNKAVAQVASDMLMLLSEQVDRLLVYHSDLPRKIVEVLSRSLSSLLPRPESSTQITAEDRRLLLSLLGCLGEWCMRLPLLALTQVQEDSRSLLHHVFEALLTGVKTGTAMSASPTRQVASPTGTMQDFDPDIHVDNLRGEVWSSPAKMKSRSGSRDLLEGVSLPLFQDEGPASVVQLAARTILSHLVNHLNHFPQAIGAASLSSQVSEHDDVPSLVSEELNMETFQAPNIQLFVLNNTTLLSLVEVPGMDQGVAEFATAASQVRVILRDISGKFSWDASVLYSPQPSHQPPPQSHTLQSPMVAAPGPSQAPTVTSPPRHTTRHRPAQELPTHESAAQDLDQLDDLLQYLGHTSPELLCDPGRPLNCVSPWAGVEPGVEGELISTVINQRNIDLDHLTRQSFQPHRSTARPVLPPEIHNEHSHQPFQHARILFQQLGLSSWEKRPHIHLVSKNEQLVRELKNLDGQKGRETHKIAVIYVAEGQEDKISILSNTSGSEAFEEFVAGLGWEVELESHTGFLGGLTRNRTTGETAPYYATSFMEIMFHVSTRMASLSEESMLQKTRHLGNDEVHIVWTEHWRDYRRGILPTEFCDVLIVIYPLKNNLFRIQVTRKPEVPFFGPLYNEMIVDQGVLPGLVRATAVNASRAKRAMMSHYQTYYEERAKALDAIIDKFKQPSTFEEFVANVYSPSQLGTILQGSLRSANQSCGSVSTSNHSRNDMSAVLLDQGVLEDKRHGWEEGGQVRPRAHTEHELRGSRGQETEHTVLTRTGDPGQQQHRPLGPRLSGQAFQPMNVSQPNNETDDPMCGEERRGVHQYTGDERRGGGPPYNGEDRRVGPQYNGEDRRGGPSYNGEDKRGGPPYNGEDRRGIPYKNTANIGGGVRRPLAVRQNSGTGDNSEVPVTSRKR